METFEHLPAEPSLLAWARTARPVRLVWPLRSETALLQTVEAAPERATDVEPDREPRLDDTLFGSASLALAAVIVVALLVV